MSVDCELYVGYTVNLKNNLDYEDFVFFENGLNEYKKFDCEGKAILLVDGMNGNYAKIIFVDKKICDIWACDDYYKLQNGNIPDEVYNEMNKLYTAIYGQELDKRLIEYGLTVRFV